MTLGAISITCSRNGPRLNELRAGTIYSHMCWLLQGVLTHHRTKLQGHFHLVVQVMQSLLRCLFTPLPHSSTKTDKIFGAAPSWLVSRKHGLKARHAVAYTRLVLMICDPTVSAVRGAQQNNLTSAKDKAKRMAGIHMQYVLILYIKLQLEMKMLPEIREKMVPGLYAIFDTTTPESRRMVSDSLDSSGRAVFGTLYKDWQRFGKWGGS
jgi:nucleolar pre-ribosomal-associated protein 2